MAFEVYRPNVRVVSLGPDEIGIQKTGMCISQFSKRMGSPPAVAVAFDRSTRTIRLTPCPAHGGGLTVGKKSGQINCRKFYAQFGITERGRVRGTFKDGHVYIHLGPILATAEPSLDREELVA